MTFNDVSLLLPTSSLGRCLSSAVDISHHRPTFIIVANLNQEKVKKKSAEVRERSSSKLNGFLNMICISSITRKEHMKIQVSEINDSDIMSLCSISLPCHEPKLHSDDMWMGPKIRMSLPSLSGRTIYNPHLLKYACDIECRVRTVKAVKVSGSTNKSDDDKPEVHPLNTITSKEDDAVNGCISILLSKPLLALEFNFLKMHVDAPTIVAHHTNVVEDSGTCLGD